MTFIAKYRGDCSPGGDRIRPGDAIEKLGYSYAHSKCVREAAEAGRFDRIEGVQPPSFEQQEYADGIEDAKRYRFERDTMGEAWAAANEYARDLRGLNGDVW